MKVTINNKAYNNVFEIGHNGYGQIYFYYYNEKSVTQTKVIENSNEKTIVTIITNPGVTNHEI